MQLNRDYIGIYDPNDGESNGKANGTSFGNLVYTGPDTIGVGSHFVGDLGKYGAQALFRMWCLGFPEIGLRK